MTKVRKKRGPGRPRGSPNKSVLDRMTRKLERVLVDKAMSGDVEAIRTCFEILGRRVKPKKPSAGASV